MGVRAGGRRNSKDSGADSKGADNEGSQMGLAGGAAGHDVTHGDMRDLELQIVSVIYTHREIHPSWARPFDEGQGEGDSGGHVCSCSREFTKLLAGILFP